MRDFIVRRNGSIIGVLSAHDVPAKDDRLIFNGDEYVVIARKIIFNHVDGATPDVGDTIMQIDPPEVHVNHVRRLDSHG